MSWKIFLLALFVGTGAEEEEKRHFEYCVVGAGPFGHQTAYYLGKARLDYMVFERNNQSGSFFAKFPRHRKLISLNKVNTGTKNSEYNLRHDWNSLLVNEDDQSLDFKSYSRENFPHADHLVRYLHDYRLKYDLKVKFNTAISDIRCMSNSDSTTKKNCSLFKMRDQFNKAYSCKYSCL